MFQFNIISISIRQGKILTINLFYNYSQRDWSSYILLSEDVSVRQYISDDALLSSKVVLVGLNMYMYAAIYFL